MARTNNRQEIERAVNMLENGKSRDYHHEFYMLCPRHKKVHIFRRGTDSECKRSIIEETKFN